VHNRLAPGIVEEQTLRKRGREGKRQEHRQPENQIPAIPTASCDGALFRHPERVLGSIG
jgi:hypothetical protein